jgi:transposase
MMSDMDNAALFAAALGLQQPWIVARTDFDPAIKELHIYLDFPRGSTFPCPTCQKSCAVYDSSEKQWRHLDFFQHKAFLHARVPRADCKTHGPLTITVPWARAGSGFTLLFEALVLTLAKSMPVSDIAKLVQAHDTRLWRMIRHHVDEAREQVDMSTVTRIGMDETSMRKNHHYLTIFVDLDRSRVLYATPGKDGATLVPFLDDLTRHGGSGKQISTVSMDMSPAFIKGVREHVPDAAITYDKFHVTKLVTTAVDQVRRAEQNDSRRHYDALKSSRYALLSNPENLSDRMKEKLDCVTLSKLNLKTGRAWRMKEAFRTAYAMAGQSGALHLKQWCSWAIRSKLAPMVSAGRAILNHWDGVVQYFTSQVTNAVLESINATFQSARAKARGYRNPAYAITILYLMKGGLVVPLLHQTHSK